MQQLCDILTHKMELMVKKDPPSLTNAEKDHMLDQLLLEKKKESLRILVQTRLQQSLNDKVIVSPQEIEQIHLKSYRIMAICDAGLLPPKGGELAGLVQLYVRFFNRQNCGLRAQEITNMFRKKLCPKALLPATLLNWLVEWIRKQFQQYLKTSIHSLYVNSRQSVQVHEAVAAPTVSEIAKPSPYLIINRKPTTQHIKRNDIISSAVILSKKDQSPTREQRLSQQLEGNRKNTLSPLERQGRLATIECEERLPINKQIFYSAYVQQLQKIYHNLEDCIPDLDIGFVRLWKRGDRRKQVIRRVDEVTASITKNMIHLKEGIQRYERLYYQSHPKKIDHTEVIDSSPEGQIISGTNIKSKKGRGASSSERQISQRRKRIISSLDSNRYSSCEEQSNSDSNLLLSHQVPAARPRQWEVKSRTVDLSLDLNWKENSSKILLLHSGNFSSELQIIEERARKVRARIDPSKHLHLRSGLAGKKSQKKRIRQSKSIDPVSLQESIAYSSLPATLPPEASSPFHLPRIRLFKS